MPNNGQLKVWNCPLCHIMDKNNNGLHHSYVLTNRYFNKMVSIDRTLENYTLVSKWQSPAWR